MIRTLSILVLHFCFASFCYSSDRSYIGTHFHGIGSKSFLVDASVGSLRLWDARVGWNFLEPHKGQWDFAVLDKAVEDARGSNLELLLPLGLTPRWASALPDSVSAYALGNGSPPRLLVDWENYVRTVVERYRGRIHAYEIWNEPNRPLFFAGDQESLFRLTCSASRIIREIDPQAKIVSSAPTDQLHGVRWLKAYLEWPIEKCVDVIGFHFYTLAHELPEAIIPLIGSVRQTLDDRGLNRLPIWNTEFGWYIKNARVPNTIKYKQLDPIQARDFLLRSFILQASGGIERSFHYAWNNGRMGVVEPDDGSEKPTVDAYRAAAKWLGQGSSVKCVPEESLMICSIVRKDDLRMIVWRISGRQMFEISPKLKLSFIQNSNLDISQVKGALVAVDESPVCFSKNASGC